MGVVLDILARDTSDKKVRERFKQNKAWSLHPILGLISDQKKVLTASEYRREGADYTGQQLAELYEGLKSNFDYIDRTKHLR
jgi:hypothetical protein